MAKKPKNKNTDANIDLKSLFDAINRKDRGFWDTLTAEQQKKFSYWLYNRYMSNVLGSADLQRYYLRANNLYSNHRGGSLSVEKYGKLCYLSLTTIPPGGYNPKHSFIPPMPRLKTKDGGTNHKFRVLLDLFPEMKIDDVKLMSELISTEQLQTLMQSYGMSDQQIAQALKTQSDSTVEENG